MKYILSILILLIGYDTFSQESLRLEYLTWTNSRLDKMQADTLSYQYIIKYFKGNDLKKTEYCRNRKDSLGVFKKMVFSVDYYLEANENEDNVRSVYPTESFNFKFNFIKENKIGDYTLISKVNKISIVNSNQIEKENYMFDSKKRLISKEVISETNGISNKKVSVKFLYNETYEIILYCDYMKKECSVFSNNNASELIETFSLEHFATLKLKYFPYQEIKYYADSSLDHTLDEKFQTTENTIYKTEIGTRTDAVKINKLKRYSKSYFKKDNVYKVEYYENEKIKNIDYYLSANENEKKIIKILKLKDNAFCLIKKEKVKKGRVLEKKSCYVKGSLVYTYKQLKDSIGQVLAIEYDNNDVPDFSKSVKRYYNYQGFELFQCTYRKDKSLDKVKIFYNDVFIKPIEFKGEEWKKVKYYLFPNEDISFYETASLN